MVQTDLRRTAMDLLARREHSRFEISEKLRRKYADASEHFDVVLDQLEQDGLLSDERFAEAYVRYRRSRGFGPLLIRQELRGKGIDSALLEAVIDMRAEEWLDTLRDLIAKKCRSEPARDRFCGSGPARDEPSEAFLRERGSLLQKPSRALLPQSDAVKARQKLYRFCLSRGFTSDQIDCAIR